jgi:peptidoglycan/LPS O-acetylase OafA/YrhL
MTQIKERDNVLDIWRGVSVIFVIVQHLVFVRYSDYLKGSLFQSLSQSVTAVGHFFYLLDKLLIAFALRSGPWGVRIFFVISGFIITKLLIDEERAVGSVSLKRFFARRVFRIVPAFAVYLAFVALFSGIGWIVLSSGDIPAAAGYLCNAGIAECGWNVTHTWTLAVEAQFYLVWPFIFAAFRPRTRVWILSGLFVGFVLLSSFGILLVHTWIDNALSFACIIVGALFAQSPRFADFVKRRGLQTVAVAAVTILALSRMPHLGDFAHVLYRAATPFSILTVVMATYRLPRLSRSRVGSWLAALGLVSYSVYLWQEVFLGLPSNYPSPSFLLFPPLLVVFAVASYFFVEKPVLRWARKAIGMRVSEKVPAV